MMATHPSASAQAHNLRWFVWTIMFLLTTGVLLVTYITYANISDDANNYTGFPTHTVKKNTAAQQ